MKDFLRAVKSGEFKVPVCPDCNQFVWPPSRFCYRCLSRTELGRPVATTGVLVEFTDLNCGTVTETFGLVHLEDGIDLIAKIDTDDNISPGSVLRMNGCGLLPDGTPFYSFHPISQQDRSANREI